MPGGGRSALIRQRWTPRSTAMDPVDFWDSPYQALWDPTRRAPAQPIDHGSGSGSGSAGGPIGTRPINSHFFNGTPRSSALIGAVNNSTAVRSRFSRRPSRRDGLVQLDRPMPALSIAAIGGRSLASSPIGGALAAPAFGACFRPRRVHKQTSSRQGIRLTRDRSLEYAKAHALR